MKQWYEQLFENYGEKYDRESFVRGTHGECDFIEREINFDKSLKIIDVGCGTGRHTIELTQRGYQVTGFDLSDSMLAKAREKAGKLKLSINFCQGDARKLPFTQEFNVAIMLCEGGFSLMETDEMNYEILKGIARSLTEKGKLIFTTLNGLFPLFHSVEAFCSANTEKGNSSCQKNTFDLMTFRDHNVTTLEDDQGNTKVLTCNERFYIPPEITWLLKTVGFSKIDIYGAKLGAFSREDKLTAEDFEMLIIAEK